MSARDSLNAYAPFADTAAFVAACSAISKAASKRSGEVIWKFKPEVASHARAFLFHPTQVFEDQPDGSLIVRFSASGHLEMCWHLYMWGDQVEVLAREILRRMVDPSGDQTLALYLGANASLRSTALNQRGNRFRECSFAFSDDPNYLK